MREWKPHIMPKERFSRVKKSSSKARVLRCLFNINERLLGPVEYKVSSLPAAMHAVGSSQVYIDIILKTQIIPPHSNWKLLKIHFRWSTECVCQKDSNSLSHPQFPSAYVEIWKKSNNLSLCWSTACSMGEKLKHMADTEKFFSFKFS